MATATTIEYDPATHGALAGFLAQAPAGAVIALPAGALEGPLVVTRDVTLEGRGPLETSIDGRADGSVISVEEGARSVRVRGVTLRDGDARFGGALFVTGGAKVEVEECVLVKCRGRRGGGAIALVSGEVRLKKCLVHGNSAPYGGGAFVDGTGTLVLDDVVLEDNDAQAGGGIFAREEAIVRLRSAWVRRNGASGEGASALEAEGTLTRAPVIEAQGGALAGGAPAIVLRAAPGAKMGPKLSAKDCVLPAAARDVPGFADKGGNQYQ